MVAGGRSTGRGWNSPLARHPAIRQYKQPVAVDRVRLTTRPTFSFFSLSFFLSSFPLLRLSCRGKRLYVYRGEKGNFEYHECLRYSRRGRGKGNLFSRDFYFSLVEWSFDHARIIGAIYYDFVDEFWKWYWIYLWSLSLDNKEIIMAWQNRSFDSESDEDRLREDSFDPRVNFKCIINPWSPYWSDESFWICWIIKEARN